MDPTRAAVESPSLPRRLGEEADEPVGRSAAALTPRPAAVPPTPELLGLDEDELDAEMGNTHQAGGPPKSPESQNGNGKENEAETAANDPIFASKQKELEFLYSAFAAGTNDEDLVNAIQSVLYREGIGPGIFSTSQSATPAVEESGAACENRVEAETSLRFG